MSGFLQFLRSGAFLTRERIWLWGIALLIAYTAAIGFLFATAHGLNDYDGRPLGTDFSDIYVAGLSALHGDPVSIFDPVRQYAHEQALFGKATLFYGWHYPPFFLLIATPLAALPYLPSLIVWQLSSFALYLGAIAWLLWRGPMPQILRDKIWILAAAAFPAVFVNLTHGHNGFLTAALLGGGLVALDRRPILAGVLFGLMAYKPQFGLMIPLALLAEGRWRTLLSAAIAVAALALLTTSVFGLAVWPAFFHSLSFTRAVVLEEGGAGFYKIQSAFALVRLWNGSLPLAYGVQAIVTVTTAALLFLYWRGPAPKARKGAALCIGALLATPYCFDYDMMALAPAIALLAADGLRRGFGNYEKLAVAALWLIPLIARPLAEQTNIPLGMPVMLAVFLHLTRDVFAWRSKTTPLQA